MQFKALTWLAILLAGPAQASNDQIVRAPAPGWANPSELMSVPEAPGGLLFVRRWDTLVHLGANGQTQYLGYRIKILHPNALQLGNISLAWNPAAGAPVVHDVRVHRGDASVDVLKTASFDILRREDQLEAASLNGVLTAVLRVPDLRVGDELEVSLSTPMSDPTLGRNDTGLLFLAPEPAPGRFRLALNWDEGHKPQIKMTSEMKAVAKQEARSVRLDFDNPALLAPPQGAPARFGWQRVVEYSDFTDWAAVSRHFAPLYAKASALEAGSPLREEASRIGKAHADPVERARAALKLVQQEVRYIYVGLDGGNLTPATAGETWQRRYGDCKGKTALLLGLLAELGIEAHPVLVNNAGTDDGLDERLPNPGLFNHVLVRARIGGADYWLDGTLPPVAGPSIEPVVPYRWTLPVMAAGSSIERREWRPARSPDEITAYEIDARAGFDQPAKVVSTTISRGLKGLAQQVQFSGLTPAQLLSGMRQQLIGEGWNSVEDVTWRYDIKAQASLLTIKGVRTIEWDDDGGGKRSISLPGGGFSPPPRRLRAAEQDQKAPYGNDPDFTCHVTTVRLPTTTQPRNWTYNTSYDTQLFGRNYHRAFELRDGAIRMIRGSRIEQREIAAAAALRDNGRIEAFDNSMAWIYYNPFGDKFATPVQANVPATYEIDWTAENVPCLGTATEG